MTQVFVQFVNNFNIYTSLMTSKHTESQLYTQRIYIDPEHLIQLKRERKTFKQVPSIFQPPPEIDETRQTSTLSNHKPSIPTTSFKQQQISHDELITKNSSPNVEFLVSLMGDIKSDQVIWYEQGDCIGVREDDRCLILEGLVKITGVGGRTFMLGQGNILFIHPQTIEKVKQILCVKASKVLRLPNSIFSTLRNYLFLKNAEKIKYLKYCPFFIWAESLTEDLASCMSMKIFDRGHYIYTRGDPSELIYFVKEGVVLLERSVLLNNEVMKQYESHYERSEISTSETTLIAKKGMVFGIDGILLKDISDRPISVERNMDNPETRFERRVKPTTRVYTSRTLGRTQVYVLERSLLEGLFDVADLLSPRNFQKQLTKEDLQRICSDYTEMVVKKHRSLPKFAQAVTTKQMTFEPTEQNIEDLILKKTKVKMVRQYEQNVKKHSIANIISDSKALKKREDKQKDNQSIIIQKHFSQRLGISQMMEQAGLAFPRLSSSLKKKRMLKKDSRQYNADKYVLNWVKSEDPIKPKSKQKKTPSQNFARLKLINVKSYRSIVPPLN